MKIANFKISSDAPPFIIAEMSGNHNRSVETAKAIIKAAKAAGAHAIKLQTYTPDTLTINQKGGLFDIKDKSSLWYGKNLYELYKEGMTPWEWHKELFEYARKLGIICFSTPFDESAVDFLERFHPPAYKIASFENNYHDLLKRVAKTKKPVIMSTGISTLSELDESVKVLRDSGCKELVLLKCTSSYPASPEDSNLLTIPHMKQLFGCEVGLSDHTMGIGVALAAVALGARIIEKHFTLKRSDGGVDSAFSLEPPELQSLVTEAERAWQSLGCVRYGILKTEEKSKRFKRSIYVVKDVKAGQVLSRKNLRVIRPGDGLEPKFFNVVVGKKFKRNIKTGTPLCWSDII